MDEQRERLNEIICSQIQDECFRYCNHPYCDRVENITDQLLAEGVIVPPCKVGDTVYYLTTIDTDTELDVSEIFCGEVLGIGIETTGVYILVHYTNGLYYTHKSTEFGKIVFLTREEAYQALAERKR